MVNKKRIIVFLAFIIFSLTLVVGAHIVKYSNNTTTFRILEDVQYVLNFTVNNGDSEPEANITHVNITISTNITLIDESWGSDAADYSFQNITSPDGLTNSLCWNQTDGGLVPYNTIKQFWFNATVLQPGTYPIIITTISENGTIVSTELNLIVNDTTPPSTVEFVSNSLANNTNISSTTTFFYNISVIDNGGVIDTVKVYLYNSSKHVISTETFVSPPYSGSFPISLLEIENGTYYVNASANDTYGNTNWSTLRTYYADIIPPRITFGIGTPVPYTNTTVNSLYVNISVMDINLANVTFALYNDTATVNISSRNAGTYTINWTDLPDGNYTYEVNATDLWNNKNSTGLRRIIIDNVAPVIALNEPVNGANITIREANFTFRINETNNIESCTLIMNNVTVRTSTSIGRTFGGIMNYSTADGVYTWKVNCTDYSGNTGTSNVFIINFAAVNTTSSGSSTTVGGGGGGGAKNSPTVVTILNKELEKGFSRNVQSNWKLQFNYEGLQHSILFDYVSSNGVQVTVSSIPQTANIAVGESKKFEITGDNVYDLLVTVNKVVGGRTASVSIMSIKEPIITPSSLPNNVATENKNVGASPSDDYVDINPAIVTEEENSKLWLWLLVGFLVAIIVIATVISIIKRKR